MVQFKLFLFATVTSFAVGASIGHASLVAPKRYSCISGSCQLNPQTADANATVSTSQSVCLLTCGQGYLWPYPTGYVDIKESTSPVRFDIDSVIASIQDNKVENFLMRQLHQIETNLRSKTKKTDDWSNYAKETSLPVVWSFDIKDADSDVMKIGTDESYSLSIKSTSNSIMISISSMTVFGARHALETLSQLIAFDEISRSFVIASDVTITNDKPQFAYRGFMLDVSRHFISKESIKRTIWAMSYNKMNVLHLHISDTASFPVALKSQPNIPYYGAYSNEELYTVSDLAELESFANSFGVMILPELDGPAHISAGYQWGPSQGLGDLAICIDPEAAHTTDWTLSGLGPPTGQLNLGNQNVYPLLADVHKEIITQGFPLSSRFHVGGDEIMVGSDDSWASCYNSTTKAKDIVALLEDRGLDRNDPQSFYTLWKEYNYAIDGIVTDSYSHSNDNNNKKRSKEKSGFQKMHIWGGNGLDATGVTYNLMVQPDVTTALPPSKYAIQVWDTSTDSIVPTLVSQGYEVVLSHTDYVYLDCGNAGWAHAGGYWCQPYHEWQHIYEYISDLKTQWGSSVDWESGKVLGAETLAWSEMISDINLDQKVWPRTAALAEALWGQVQGKGDTWFAADPRLQQWTRTLQQRGIAAEPLQTAWCDHRGAYACSINSGTPQ